MNQTKYKYQTVCSARFDEEDEDDQVFDEFEMYFNLNNNQILTESDIDNFNIRSQSERQIQNQK